MNQELYLHDKAVYEPFEDKFFKGYRKAREVENLKTVTLTWKGPSISQAQWKLIKAFMRQSYGKHKEETLMYFMFNHTGDGEWDLWVPPQFMNGMSVSADHECDEFKEQRARWDKNWVIGGTIHHHCETSAFASSTDDTDETDKDGFHLTMGHVDRDEVDLDARMLYDGNKYDIKASYIVESGVDVQALRNMGVSDALIAKVEDEALAKTDVSGVEVPEEWMKNLKKKTWHGGGVVQLGGWRGKGLGKTSKTKHTMGIITDDPETSTDWCADEAARAWRVNLGNMRQCLPKDSPLHDVITGAYTAPKKLFYPTGTCGWLTLTSKNKIKKIPSILATLEDSGFPLDSFLTILDDTYLFHYDLDPNIDNYKFIVEYSEEQAELAEDMEDVAGVVPDESVIKYAHKTAKKHEITILDLILTLRAHLMGVV